MRISVFSKENIIASYTFKNVKLVWTGSKDKKKGIITLCDLYIPFLKKFLPLDIKIMVTSEYNFNTNEEYEVMVTPSLFN